jgi:hypothetical protein
MRDDAWPRLFSTQNTAVHAMRQAAETGIATTAPDDPAHVRLARMRDFYQFLLRELPDLPRRWEQEHFHP